MIGDGVLRWQGSPEPLAARYDRDVALDDSLGHESNVGDEPHGGNALGVTR